MMPPARERSLSQEEDTESTSSAGSADSVENNLRYGEAIGYVLADRKSEYLGTCPINAPSGKKPAAAGVKSIKKQKTPPRTVQVVVSVKGVFILDTAGGAEPEIINKTAIAEVSYVEVDPYDHYSLSTAKGGYCFIHNNAEQKLMALFSFSTDGDPADVAIAINEAVNIHSGKVPAPDPAKPRSLQSLKEARAAAAGGKGEAKAKADPHLVGNFKAKHLFSLAVDKVTGMAVIDAALAQASTLGIPSSKPCTLVVSIDGLKTLDRSTHEPIVNTPIKEVTFWCVTGPKKRFFAYISKHKLTGRIVCHMFKRKSNAEAAQVIEAFGDAIARALKVANKNVFLANDTAREKPPAVLLRRQVRRGDLNPLMVLGQGQFGQVWGAHIAARDSGSTTYAAGQVAVKLLKGACSAENKIGFIRECTMMLELNHPNLVNMIGVAVQQKPWLCVLEFLVYGDIRAVLRGCVKMGIDVRSSVVVHMSSQVLAGMAHMASLNLVHMDLAARNVLLHVGNLVKVADFGLTQKLDSEGKFTLAKTMKLPVKWMAPEGMAPSIFTEKSDVWSFGITVWEMFSYGALPFEDQATHELPTLLREGLRLETPPLAPEGIGPLLEVCWAFRPSDRASFAEIATNFMAPLMEQVGDISGDLGAELKAVRKSGAKLVSKPDWIANFCPKKVADKAIMAAEQGDFLIRQLATAPEKPKVWVMCIHDTDTVKDFLITQLPNKKFGFSGNEYDQLVGVVAFLMKNPFNGVKGTVALHKGIKVGARDVRRSSMGTDAASASPKKAATLKKKKQKTEKKNAASVSPKKAAKAAKKAATHKKKKKEKKEFKRSRSESKLPPVERVFFVAESTSRPAQDADAAQIRPNRRFVDDAVAVASARDQIRPNSPDKGRELNGLGGAEKDGEPAAAPEPQMSQNKLNKNLVAYFKKFAPGFKTDERLSRCADLAAKYFVKGTGGLDIGLKKKYGTGLYEFAEAHAVAAAPEPASEPEFEGVGDTGAGAADGGDGDGESVGSKPKPAREQDPPAKAEENVDRAAKIAQMTAATATRKGDEATELAEPLAIIDRLPDGFE